MIYFIQQNPEDDGPVKIGISKNPEQRLDTLQTASPHELELLHSALVSDDSSCETWLHNKFTSNRLKGEWFDIGWLLDEKHPASIIAQIPVTKVFETCGVCGHSVPEYHEVKPPGSLSSYAYYQCRSHTCKFRGPNKPVSYKAADAWNRIQKALKEG